MNPSHVLYWSGLFLQDRIQYFCCVIWHIITWSKCLDKICKAIELCKTLVWLVVSSSLSMLPVSLLQRRSIFGPADFGRWDALCRTEYGQWPGGVGEEGALSNADVDVLLEGQWKVRLLSDDHWSAPSCLQWRALWPVGQSVCGQIRHKHKIQEF